MELVGLNRIQTLPKTVPKSRALQQFRFVPDLREIGKTLKFQISARTRFKSKEGLTPSLHLIDFGRMNCPKSRGTVANTDRWLTHRIDVMEVRSPLLDD